MKVSLVGIPVQDPVKAHEIYTTTLGFKTKEFVSDASLAIVVSALDAQGVAILLDPCKGSFAERYQKDAYQANLPLLVLEVENVEAEIKRLKDNGVVLRPELDNPKWGIENVFEDGCGNLLMMEEMSPKRT